QYFLCFKDFLVTALIEPASRFVFRGPCELPRDWMTDADRRCHRFGAIDHCTTQKGSGAGRLITHHDGTFPGESSHLVWRSRVQARRTFGFHTRGFAVTHPMRRHVSSITDRKDMVVRTIAQRFTDFE